jgi:energy-coupling factor transporter ATP-binding protein EcfA2
LETRTKNDSSQRGGNENVDASRSPRRPARHKGLKLRYHPYQIQPEHGDIMHVKQIAITNIGGIGDLLIRFDDQMNVICGPNGIGKTTILESVAQAFAGMQTTMLKRRVTSEQGKVVADLANAAGNKQVIFDVKSFIPDQYDYFGLDQDLNRQLLSLKVARTFSYSALPSVTRDATRDVNTLSQDNRNGVKLNEVKNWFVNRYLYAPHGTALTATQLHNLEVAKRFFTLLNPSFQFSRVDAGSNEIMVDTPSGEIYFEYLSAGFKSCLSILLGITKELEYRFKDPTIKVDEFTGVILIDELELHLHPEWQAKIAGILMQAFPASQFIATTHSPHVIQAAEPQQVVALEFIEGKVVKRELPQNKYGFKGWTVEEVLEDVMGMKDTRTPVYKAALKKFENAVDSEDFETAASAYAELDLLLHPESHLRKLFAFQLGALRG